MVMVSNQTSLQVGYLAGAFPGSVGHLYSPGGERGPWPFLPHALDNGAWGAYLNKRPFDLDAWRQLLRWSALRAIRPLWAAVPDVVGDRDGTLAAWPKYVDEVRAYGLRPAFVLQDGMDGRDIPDSECMLFLGGSTEWKLGTVRDWCARYPGRVHVGRINTLEPLILCYRAGAVSVDGTGWHHHKQMNDLCKFVREVHSPRVALEAA